MYNMLKQYGENVKIKKIITKSLRWLAKSLESLILKTKFMARPKFEGTIFTYSSQEGVGFAGVSITYDNSTGPVGKYFGNIYRAVGKSLSLKPSYACALTMGPLGVLCETIRDMYDLFSVDTTITEDTVRTNHVNGLYGTQAYGDFYCEHEEDLERSGMDRQEYEKALFSHRAYYIFSSFALNVFLVAKDIARKIAEIILPYAVISTIYGIIGVAYLSIVIWAVKIGGDTEPDVVTRLRKLEAVIRKRRRLLVSLVNFNKKIKKEERSLRHASWLVNLYEKMDGDNITDQAKTFLQNSPEGFKPQWILDIEAAENSGEDKQEKLTPDQAEQVISQIKEKIQTKEDAEKYAEAVYEKAKLRFSFWGMFKRAMKSITLEIVFDAFIPDPGKIVVYSIAFLIFAATIPFGSIWIPVGLVIVGIVFKPVIDWINNQIKEVATAVYLRMTYLRQKLPILDRFFGIKVANTKDCTGNTAFYEFAALGNGEGCVESSMQEYSHPTGENFSHMSARAA